MKPIFVQRRLNWCHLLIGTAICFAVVGCKKSSEPKTVESESRPATAPSSGSESPPTTPAPGADTESTASAGCGKPVPADGSTMSLEVDGRQREALVYRPKGYDGKTPAPLMVALHGSNMPAEMMRDHSGLKSLADKAGYVLIFPQATAKTSTVDQSEWNVGKCCGHASENNIDDEKFLNEVRRSLTETLCIDTSRIYAVGFSMGGTFVNALACHQPQQFAAFVSVAGTNMNVSPQCKSKTPIPYLEIHGTNDEIVPYEGKGPFDTSSVESVLATMRKINQCEGEPTPTAELSGCLESPGCASGSAVVHCRLEGGKHQWPGATFKNEGDPRWQGWDFPPDLAFPTNDVIHTFLSRYPSKSAASE